MGLYEVMFIIRPELETEEHEEVLNGIKNTITGNGGTVDKLVDWRKRRLAYEFEKHTEGHYYLVYFKGQGTVIPELEHFFKVNDAVLRVLIVRVEEDYYETAAAEEPQAEGAAAPEEPVDQEEPAAAAVDSGQDAGEEMGGGENTAEPAETVEGGSVENEQPSEEKDKE